jgi:hypothetical protein
MILHHQYQQQELTNAFKSTGIKKIVQRDDSRRFNSRG